LSSASGWPCKPAKRIAADDFRSIEFAVMAVAACAVALTIIRNWRTGFYMFLTWLLFEDLVRKYLGNNMAIYFAKDILVGLVYASFLIEVRRKHLKLFRSAFFPFLWLFVWFGTVQIFNQNSPHLLYGLLGFALYFYYIPLMFVSYALLFGIQVPENFDWPYARTNIAEFWLWRCRSMPKNPRKNRRLRISWPRSTGKHSRVTARSLGRTSS
jgi:hypothetical protein